MAGQNRWSKHQKAKLGISACPTLFLSLSLSLSLFLSLILTLDINPNGLMIILLLQPSEPRSGEHNVKNERSTLHIPRSHSSHMVAVYVCTHNHEQGFR